MGPVMSEEKATELLNARFLEWVREHRDSGAVSVTKVVPYGTDWAGDTEGGFYSEFSVCITYIGQDGKEKSRGVEGDEMESLWKAVVW